MSAVEIPAKVGIKAHERWQHVSRFVEGSVDPMGVVTPLLHAQLAWLSHPLELIEAAADFSAKVVELQWHAWRRASGMQDADVETPNPDDTRFSDAEWIDSATWDIAKEWYLVVTREIQDMLYRTPGMSSKDRAPGRILVEKVAQRDVADQLSHDQPGCFA